MWQTMSHWRRRTSLWIAVVAVIAAVPIGLARAQDPDDDEQGPLGPPPVLGLPVACQMGEACFIQNYVDVDPERPSAKDFRCGEAAYDNHSGTDFRVLNIEMAEKGVAVVAAADGRVLRLRDGMPDRLFMRHLRAVDSKVACGNGVIIDHGGGWQTQYCHMRKGSLTVSQGTHVKRGAKLGEVGYSGLAAFPHVHLTVRANGTVIDPFTGRDQSGGCGTESASPLWDPALGEALAYAGGKIIEAGFAGGPVKPLQLEKGPSARAAPIAAGDMLVVFGRAMHVRQGDVFRFDIAGPDGFRLSTVGKPVPRNQAHHVSYAGKPRPGWSFRHGNYKGKVQLMRDGRVISERAVSIDLR